MRLFYLGFGGFKGTSGCPTCKVRLHPDACSCHCHVDLYRLPFPVEKKDWRVFLHHIRLVCGLRLYSGYLLRSQMLIKLNMLFSRGTCKNILCEQVPHAWKRISIFIQNEFTVPTHSNITFASHSPFFLPIRKLHLEEPIA